MRFSVFANNWFWSLLLYKYFAQSIWNLCIIANFESEIIEYFYSWRTLSIRHELRWQSSSTLSNSAPYLTGTHHHISIYTKTISFFIKKTRKVHKSKLYDYQGALLKICGGWIDFPQFFAFSLNLKFFFCPYTIFYSVTRCCLVSWTKVRIKGKSKSRISGSPTYTLVIVPGFPAACLLEIVVFSQDTTEDPHNWGLAWLACSWPADAGPARAGLKASQG